MLTRVDLAERMSSLLDGIDDSATRGGYVDAAAWRRLHKEVASAYNRFLSPPLFEPENDTDPSGCNLVENPDEISGFGDF